MKIAIPIFNFSKKGGIERHTYEFVKRISADNEVHIFSHTIENTDNIKLVWHKVPVLKLGMLTHPFFVIVNSIMLKKEKFDIIYNNGCGATMLQDVITSASCHKAWMKETKKAGLKKHFLNPMHYWTILVESLNYRKGHYKRIIAISNFIKKHLMNYHNIPEDKISVVYHGVNLDEFNPKNKSKYSALIKNKYSISENDVVLLFIGNEFKRKGLMYVFEAMEILDNKNLKLLVVGNGEIALFKALADKFGIRDNVVFTGFDDDVAGLYSASDIFVMPSTFDAFALVVLEAMASGVPVITSKTTGASEIIEHNSDGFVLDSYDNSGQIADIIRRLILDKELRDKIAFAARKKAEGFSWDMISKKTMEVFENACRDK